MTQWANFEIGWKRYQDAWNAYKAPIFSGEATSPRNVEFRAKIDG